jgi:hypothetical protein
MKSVRTHMQNLELVADLQRQITQACDCSFFFWNRV